MRLSDDNIATIVPDDSFADPEERFLVCAIQSLHAFKEYLALVATSRLVRKLGHEDLGLAQDFAIDSERGLQRALGRRRRELGALAAVHGKQVA